MDETKGTTPQRKSKGEKKKCEKQKNQKKKTKRRNIYTVYKKSWRKKIGGTLEALERISQLHLKQQEVGSRSRRTKRQRKIDEK
jgi:hypothetical protein